MAAFLIDRDVKKMHHRICYHDYAVKASPNYRIAAKQEELHKKRR